MKLNEGMVNSLQKIKTPIGLSAVVSSLFIYSYNSIIGKDIFTKMGEEYTFYILKYIIFFIFIFSITLIIIVFLIPHLTKALEKKESQVIKKPRTRNKAVTGKFFTKNPLPQKKLIGREKDLDRITKKLTKGNSKLILTGLAGIGKTDLCKEYLYRNQHNFKYVGWIECKNSLNKAFFEQLIDSNGNSLLDPKESYYGKGFDKVINHLRTLDPKTLLIIDNLPDLEYINLLLELPFKIIINTNIHHADLGLDTLNLNTLSLESCKKLFKNYYDFKRFQSRDEVLESIIKIADRHTYTIEYLAKCAEKNLWSLDNLHTTLTDILSKEDFSKVTYSWQAIWKKFLFYYVKQLN